MHCLSPANRNLPSVDPMPSHKHGLRETGLFFSPLYSSTNWFKTCNYLLLGVAVNWIKVVSYSWVNYLHLPTWWARLDKRAEEMDLDSCLPHGKKWKFPTEGDDVLVVSVRAMFHLLLLFQKCNYLCYRQLNGQSPAKKPTYLPRPPECAILHGTVACSVRHTISLLQQQRPEFFLFSAILFHFLCKLNCMSPG